MQNRTIENPIIRDKIAFVRTTEETGGGVSEIIVELSVGGGNEPHYHTTFAESFTPIEGELLAPVFRWVARRARKNGAEQELVNRYCT